MTQTLKIKIKETTTETRELNSGEAFMFDVFCSSPGISTQRICEEYFKRIGFQCKMVGYERLGKFKYTKTTRDATEEEISAWHFLKATGKRGLRYDEDIPFSVFLNTRSLAYNVLKDKEVILELVEE
jgi:hypothetical protein